MASTFTASAATDSHSRSAFTFNPTLGDDVFSPWRNYPGLSPEFAYPAAFGDLVTAILAFVAIPLVLRGSRAAKPAVRVFNLSGTIDLLVAIATATIYNAPVEMGPAYWIPAFWVPLLLVTHYITFVILLRRRNF